MERPGNRGRETRRRRDKESGEGRSKKARSRESNDDATEEQVEEFFAILRRMQEAVRYFEKESGGGWRAALEAEVVAVVGKDSDEDDKAEETGIDNDKKPSAEVETGVLDLNAIPDVESSEMQTVASFSAGTMSGGAAARG